MPIVCVTNLSPQSERAGTTAAALAARLNEPLALYGVAEHEAPTGIGSRALAPLSERLEAEAQRLRGLGAQVHAVRLFHLDGVISDEECRQARWLVLASEGWMAPAWRRTPLPERLMRRACAPVLVVRNNDGALVEWARGRRRLLVMVGVNASEEADGATGLPARAARGGAV